MAVFSGGAAVGNFVVFADEGGQGAEEVVVAGSSAEDAGCGGVPEGLPAVFPEGVDGLGAGLEVGVEDDAHGPVEGVNGG